jgi:hypothetical protein
MDSAYDNQEALDAANSGESKGKSSVLLVVIIVVLVAVVAYLIFVKPADDTSDPDNDNEVEATATPTAEVVNETPEPTLEPTAAVEPTQVVTSVEVPAGWQLMEYPSLYTTYRPTGWFFRYFGGTNDMFGVDRSAIPQVGETAGMIVTSVESGTVSAKATAIKGTLTGVSETTVTAPNGTWTVISGTQPASELGGARKVKYALTEHSSNKVMQVSFTPADDTTYATYEATFDTLYKLVDF